MSIPKLGVCYIKLYYTILVTCIQVWLICMSRRGSYQFSKLHYLIVVTNIFMCINNTNSTFIVYPQILSLLCQAYKELTIIVCNMNIYLDLSEDNKSLDEMVSFNAVTTSSISISTHVTNSGASPFNEQASTPVTGAGTTHPMYTHPLLPFL